MTLATDLTTEAIMEPYTPEYMSDLLQCSSAQSLRVAAGRRHVSGPAGMVKHCVTVSTCERNDPMNPTTVQLDQKEEETLSFEVSDEVLESAAGPRWPRLTRSPHAPAYWFARAGPAHRMNRLPADEAETVVLDLIGPLRTGRHRPADGRQARLDEAGRMQ